MRATSKRVYLSLFLLFSIVAVNAQSVLISPTGDGGFENGTSSFAANGWTAAQYASGRQWFVGTAAGAQSGTKAAYMGSATTYNGASVYRVMHFYKDVVIPVGAENVNLSFYYKQLLADPDADIFYVFTTTPDYEPVADEVPGEGFTEQMQLTNNVYNSFTQIDAIDLSSLAGTTVRLVFTFENNGSAPIAKPAIDNISLTYTLAGVPYLSNGTLDTFGNVCVGAEGNLNSFTLYGTDLTGDVTIQALTGYTYSAESDSGFASTMTVTPVDGAIAKEIYVKFSPVAVAAYNGNIQISGGGADTISIAVTGAGTNAAPTVTTPVSSAVAATTATLGGNMTAAGCSTVTERGIYYSTSAGFANGAGTKVSVVGTYTAGEYTIPVTGLTPGTTYYYKAFATNGGGNGYSAQGTFTTATQPVTLPYSQNFENVTAEWTFGTTGTNKWAIATATNNGGAKAMYVSSNGGISNAYSTTTAQAGTYSEIKVDLTLVSSATLSFDWRCNGEANDYGELYINTGGGDLLISNEKEFKGSGSYQSRSIDLSPYVGGIRILKFKWVNDASSGSQPPFAVDNISITEGGIPSLTTATATNVSYNSVTAGGNITNDGDVEVSARGVVYSTTPNPTLATGIVVSSGTGAGIFTTEITGLVEFTIYYAKAYATNSIGTAYGEQVSFITTAIDAPVAIAADVDVNGTTFTANWQSVANAVGYNLDVSSTPFGNQGNVVAGWNFPNTPDDNIADEAITANSGKTLTTVGVTGTPEYTNISAFSTSSAQIAGWNDGAGIKYWQIEFATTGYSAITVSSRQRSATAGPRDFKLQYKVGAGIWTDVAGGTVVVQNDYTTGFVNNLALPAECDNQPSVSVRWIMTSNLRVNGIDAVTSGAAHHIDEISIKGNDGNFVAGYENLAVAGTSQIVTGLTQGATYYYRVRATGGNSTSVNSNIIAATTATSILWDGNAWSNVTGPTAVDSAVIEGDYNTGLNGVFASASLVINSGILTVADGTTLTVQNDIVNNATASNFIVEDGAGLIQVNNVANTGDVTVKKFSNPLFKLDYTIWSSPVTGQNLQSFSPATLPGRFYIYGINGDGDEAYISTPASGSFDPGIGYLIRTPNSLDASDPNAVAYNAGEYAHAFEGTFTGNANNGTIEVPLSTSVEYYTMVGNPYPSPIGVEEFFNTNQSVMFPGQGIYFWRKKNSTTATSYASLTTVAYVANDGGVESGDDPGTYSYGGQQWESYFASNPSTWVISAGQGFFVRGDGQPGNLTFTNSMRRATAAGQPFFRMDGSNESQLSRIWINLHSDSNFSQTAIAYADGATTGIDHGKDALTFGSGAISIFSVAEQDTFTIQARPSFENSDAVAIGYTVAAPGNYTIALHRKDGVFATGQAVYLKDNLLNLTHDFADGAYAFSSEGGTFTGRFTIVYTIVVLGTDNPLFNAENVIVYNQDNVLKVTTGTTDMQSITIYDLRGRVIYTMEGINANNAVLTGLNAQHQVLLVQVTTQNGKVTKKVIY